MQLFGTVHALSLLCSSLTQCTLFPYYAALWHSARSSLIMQLFGTVHALSLLCSSLAQCTLFPYYAALWHSARSFLQMQAPLTIDFKLADGIILRCQHFLGWFQTRQNLCQA